MTCPLSNDDNMLRHCTAVLIRYTGIGRVPTLRAGAGVLREGEKERRVRKSLAKYKESGSFSARGHRSTRTKQARYVELGWISRPQKLFGRCLRQTNRLWSASRRQQVGWRSQLMASRLADLNQACKTSQVFQPRPGGSRIQQSLLYTSMAT